MTKNEFDNLCEELTIDPAIALECQEVRAALILDTQQHTPQSRDSIEIALINNF